MSLAAKALAVCLALTACGDNTLAPIDAAPDAEVDLGQGSEPTSDIIITEVSPSGEGADWIELHNRSAEPVDLCDFFITDSVDRLDHYLPLGGAAAPDPCEPLLFGPGEFTIIYADDDVAAGPDHAPFRLGQADEVHIVGMDGRAVDSLVYLWNGDGEQSLARIPTTTGLFFVSTETPGAANPESQP